MRSRFTALLIAPLLSISLFAGLPAAFADDQLDQVTVDLLFEDLAVAAEVPIKYERTEFKHWSRVDGYECNTRVEVLKAESLVPVQKSGNCGIVAGEWYSWFDDQTITDPSFVDIDHVIPLAEAWRSGARDWTPQQREKFANDLEYEPSLEAVSYSSNRSKGDRDPANWLPPVAEVHCQYASYWVGIKYRWRLNVDPAEHAALEGLLDEDSCGKTLVDLPERAVPETAAISFNDVAPNNSFHSEITWMGLSGISTGYADGSFRPKNPITREAMAAFMYRLAGEPAYTAPAKSQFKDVDTSDTFYQEISWLNSTKITTGYSDKTFRPKSLITREAMAAFMYRYQQQPNVSYGGWPIFTDVAPNHKFDSEITWMATSGITTGYSERGGCYTYRPGGNVTREAMAAFMYRLETGSGEPLNAGCRPNLPTVTGGAFCKKVDIGALGFTTTGLLMQCTRQGSETTPRWRAVYG